jgi:hypothetical protein
MVESPLLQGREIELTILLVLVHYFPDRGALTAHLKGNLLQGCATSQSFGNFQWVKVITHFPRN